MRRSPLRPLLTRSKAPGGGGPAGAPSTPPSGAKTSQWIIGSVLLAGGAWLGQVVAGTKQTEVTFQEFVGDYLAKGVVEHIVVVNDQTAYAVFKEGKGLGKSAVKPELTRVYITIGDVVNFDKQLERAQYMLGLCGTPDEVTVSYEKAFSFKSVIPFLPLAILLMLPLFMSRAAMSGGGIFGVGKSAAKKFDKQMVKTSFADVAGLDEAKVEVMEFVDFLRTPEKYKKLGAHMPKGALLVGPPGTGKTLLAKATAGEASVPFFATSGSDFVEMFVGVGPSRVRDLFDQARKNAPCIVFVDEIDAIGRSRAKGGFQGGNDERENTLNQLLVEMDGFKGSDGVVVLAGTNRADVLDDALLRPGRFDRQISVDLPDIAARDEIFQVHLRPLSLTHSPTHFSKRLASLTPGFSGADIANVCNEAALIAARNNQESVTMANFEAAVERVIGGLEKKNKVLAPEEKTTVAYHEAGHAVTGWLLQHCNPLIKVSIVPRGSAALGYAQYLPKDQYLYTGPQLMDAMCMTLGGRIAESIVFGKISTGASDDLDKVTQMATAQVTQFGMSKEIGPIAFKKQQDGNGFSFGRPYSERTQEKVDAEIRRLINEAYDRTYALLEKHRDDLEKVAQRLLKDEIINREVVAELIGPRPYETAEESAELDKAIAYYHHAEEDSQPQQAVVEEVEEGEGEGDDGEISGRAAAAKWWKETAEPMISKDPAWASAKKWLEESLKAEEEKEKKEEEAKEKKENEAKEKKDVKETSTEKKDGSKPGKKDGKKE